MRALFAGSFDNTVKKWSLKSGELLTTMVGHHGAITCLWVCESEGADSAGSLDRIVRKWSLKSGELLTTMTVKKWSLKNGELLQTMDFHFGQVQCSTVCGGRSFIGSADNTIRVWDLATGICIWTERIHQEIMCIMECMRGGIVTSASDSSQIALLATKALQ